MSEPWLRWPERWAMIDEYRRGATVRMLEQHYHHPHLLIGDWLRDAGVLRPHGVRSGARVRKSRTPAVRWLAEWLVAAQERLGRSPTAEEIGRLIHEIRLAKSVGAPGREEISREVAEWR